MTFDDAVALIRPAAVEQDVTVSARLAPTAAWADLGAGEGLFSRALSTLLGERAVVYALDRDGAALGALAGADGVHARRVDFTDTAAVGALALPPLDGVLLANALHFVRDDAQHRVLADWAARLTLSARVVVVEYEHRRASRWVPYPVASTRLAELTPAALSPFAVVSRRDSRFGGEMYVAVARRVGDAG